MFVHLTPQKNVRAVQRSGIKILSKKGYRPGGVYAMPVTRNFYVSHQWLRELKRGGQRTSVAFISVSPMTSRLWVGHYNQNHRVMWAAEAAAVMMAAQSREGYEVIIARKIAASEIHRVRRLPQVVGGATYRTLIRYRHACASSVTRPGRSTRVRNNKRGDARQD